MGHAMLTSAPGALVKEPKREIFALKISHFTLLKVDCSSFKRTLLYLAILTCALGYYLAFFFKN
jgi:hypothetical protein